ncbi:hypothetical protein [Deinococcus xianganensis]|uniref:Uncharacterized protein n=1 Tax=Deinococcus xianganensis TaxID=1507289 RepID=A0A6I4YXB9_9DEIO|nr:hypothetical protein [Deinococcus xianganensis]MXV21753.1 hypothetical protein [Deinococcus xianganensis]
MQRIFTLLLFAVLAGTTTAQQSNLIGMARLEELARNRDWTPATAGRCAGQAQPLYGTVVDQRAYEATGARGIQSVLDSAETDSIGFSPLKAWKPVGTFQVRTYRALPEGNVYYTFSTRSEAGRTMVCVVTWTFGKKLN